MGHENLSKSPTIAPYNPQVGVVGLAIDRCISNFSKEAGGARLQVFKRSLAQFVPNFHVFVHILRVFLVLYLLFFLFCFTAGWLE